MKTIITLCVAWILCIQCTFAGGSISWEDVKARISKTDPELVTVIEKTFIVERTGGAVRLGPQFGEQHGERIAPYEFRAKNKATKTKHALVIQESTDHEFTGRFSFEIRPERVENHAK